MNGPSVALTDCVKGKGGAQTVQCTNTVGAVTDLPLTAKENERENLIRLMLQLNWEVIAESRIVLPTTKGDYASKTKNEKQTEEDVRNV